jgi:hypothetical protein
MLAVFTVNETSQVREFAKVTTNAAFPASSFTVTSLMERAGATGSVIVTIASQVEILPQISVTVNVTVFGPISEQVNAVFDAVRDAIPQLSELLLLMSAAVMVALPPVFNGTVMFLHAAVGTIRSFTVRVWLQVALFPAASFIIQVLLTEIGQLPEATSLYVTEVIPQLSLAVPRLVAFSNSASVEAAVSTEYTGPIIAAVEQPLIFRIGGQVVITGNSLSVTVTVKLQVAIAQLLVAEITTLVTPLLKADPLPVPAPLAVVAPVNAYVTTGTGVPVAVAV